MIKWLRRLDTKHKEQPSVVDVLVRYGWDRESAEKWDKELPLRLKKAQLKVELKKIEEELNDNEKGYTIHKTGA